MLTIPPQIEGAGVRGAPVTHAWKGEATFLRSNSKLFCQLGVLTCRAELALAAALAEWIGWRFDGLVDYPKTLQVAESAWAGVIDTRYAEDFVLATEDPPAAPRPLSSPLFHANEFVSFLLCNFGGTGMCSRTVYLAHVARHVAPDKKVFQKWFKATMGRLVEFHIGDVDDDRVTRVAGELVPREAMDPSFDYEGDPEQNRELCRAFLEGLDHEVNPFLRSPEELKQDGFEGAPYTL